MMVVLLNRQTALEWGLGFPSRGQDELDAYEQAERRRTDVTLYEWYDRPDAAPMVL